MEKVSVPSDLNVELTGVWSGWNSLRNREVAREAATKGLHIPLAYKFIAARNKCELFEAKQWFNTEVRAWARQLLMQRQVFKATHVLSNIGLDPYSEFADILIETSDSDLRDYIALHLSKTKKVNNTLWCHWKLLKAIDSAHDYTVYSKNECFSNLTVSKLLDVESSQKRKIAAELFVHNFDFSLSPFLDATDIWNSLLIYNNHFLLCDWINLYFDKESKEFKNRFKKIDLAVIEKVNELFKKWEITQSMVNEIHKSNSFDSVKDIVLNELSKYGVFSDDDKKSIQRIIKRIASVKELTNIDDLVKEKNTDFDYAVAAFYLQNKFYNQFSTHFKDYKFSLELIEKLNSNELKLFLSLHDMFNNLTDGDNITKCILQTSKYFAGDNSDDYLLENPIVFLSLLLFAGKPLESVFDKNTSLVENLTFDADFLATVRNKLPLLNDFRTRDFHKQDINVYQLLANYKKIDVSQLFSFRFKPDASQIPHFETDHLIQRYGHKESVNFVFYLKQGRPSIAYKLFVTHQFKKYGKISRKHKRHVCNLTHKLACAHFKNAEITASAIAFNEMLGVSSEVLRMYVNLMNVVVKNYENSVSTLFENFNVNNIQILHLLENSLIKRLSKEDLKSFKNVNYLSDWEIAVKFATYHKIDYPELFLNYCAEHSLWLQFVTFVQYHKYPLDKIVNTAAKFKNETLSEHLCHAFGNDLKAATVTFEDNVKNKDSRKTLYSRIGLKRTDNSSQCEEPNDESEEIYNYDVDSVTVLIDSHKRMDPVKALINASRKYSNPVFSVFATFYQPKCLATCWLTWLGASIKSNDFWMLLNTQQLSSETVTDLLEIAAAKKQFSALSDSFRIFLPENPLCSFTTFLSQYVKDLDLNSCDKHIKVFKAQMTYMQYSSSPSELNDKMAFLLDRKWLLETATKLSHYALAYGFDSNYRQELFVNIFCDEKLVPDLNEFHHLKNLMLILSETDVTLDLASVLELKYCNSNRKDEFQRCIDELIVRAKFDKAFSLAQLENLNADNILVEKWNFKFKTRECDISTFWKSCEKSLRNWKVEPVAAAKFYIRIGDLVTDKLEKYIVLKFAFGWLKECEISNVEIQQVELEMWWLYLNIDVWDDFTVDFDEEPCIKSPLSDLYRKANVSSVVVTRNLENRAQEQSFEELIGTLLDKNQMVLAIRLEHMFNYKTRNVSLLKTCMRLAEGELNPYQLSPDHRALIDNAPNFASVRGRDRTLSSAKPFLESGSGSPKLGREYSELNAANSLDVETALASLTRHVRRGNNIAGRVLCCSRIATATLRSYATVLAKYEACNLLKAVFNGECVNKLEMANDIMTAHSWSKHRVAEFLCAELVSTISKYTLQETASNEPICLWGYLLDANMHLVLRLCPEPSLLGNALLAHTVAPLTSNSKNALCLAGELLIRAHDCFTADCNMEGISHVLQRARVLVSCYVRVEAWAPTVRLLTGIGRYSEMIYVFQTIQENDRFESLLGHAPAVGLKRATMDYLMRYCPGQREKSRMVALRWGLYDSAAEIWENEARDIVANFVKVARLEMQNVGTDPGPNDVIYVSASDGANKRVLENAMNCFTNAVEHYLLANRLSSANRATKSAELIALQLGILANSSSESSAVCVLELNSVQLSNLIINKLNFTEARILTAVYNYPSDWGAVLYEQCVVQNKYEKYLPAFLSAFALSDSLAKDVVRRYLINNKSSQTIPRGLTFILDAVKSPSTKYRLASELGLRDMVYNLLEGPAKSYLQDTVWTSGCPPPD